MNFINPPIDLPENVTHEEWFKLLKCPLLRVDKTKPVGELLNQIMIGEADNG
jgi:hypothetical protein